MNAGFRWFVGLDLGVGEALLLSAIGAVRLAGVALVKWLSLQLDKDSCRGGEDDHSNTMAAAGCQDPQGSDGVGF